MPASDSPALVVVTVSLPGRATTAAGFNRSIERSDDSMISSVHHIIVIDSGESHVQALKSEP
eukprot:65341-Hanusia_phi.AAC.1